MQDFWTHIRVLEGETLLTLVQNKPFEVIKTTDYACVIAVPMEDHTRPKIRVLYRADLTPLYERLMKNGELSIESIKEICKFNSSYASALLAAVEGVEMASRPILLRMNSRS